jgi:hypothetical protein
MCVDTPGARPEANVRADDRERGVRSWGSAVDWIVVLGIALLAVAVEVRLARQWELGYDETWHVFASTVEPVSQLVAELKNEAHPPLYYLLLRLTTPRGDSLLWPRIASIVPSVVTIVLVFLCARSLRIARPLALLASFGFAAAPAQLNMAVSARGYSLATMFTVWAYLHCLALLRRPTDAPGKHALAYAALAVAAIASEYSAALVIAMTAPVLAARRWLEPTASARDQSADRSVTLAALTLTVGFGAILLYRRWADFPATDHLKPFLRQADVGLFQFAREGVVQASGLLLYPFALGTSALGAVAASSVAALSVVLAIRHVAAPARDPARAATLALHLGLWAAMFTLACGRYYPFGGHLRHQYVVFPFLLLATVICLDEVYATMKSRASAAAFCAVLTIGTGVASARGHGVSLDEFAGARFWWREVATARSMLRPRDALYTHQFNLIGVFSNLRDWRWLREGRVGGLDRFVVEREREQLVVLRHPAWTVPLPPTSELVAGLASAMRASRHPGLVVLALPQPPFDLKTERRPSARADLSALCARHGLALTHHVVVDAGVIFRVEAVDGRSRSRDRG